MVEVAGDTGPDFSTRFQEVVVQGLTRFGGVLGA